VFYYVIVHSAENEKNASDCRNYIPLNNNVTLTMSAAVLLPSSEDVGPSTSTDALPSLSELVRRSVKRTRAMYSSEFNGIDDGLEKAFVWAFLTQS